MNVNTANVGAEIFSLDCDPTLATAQFPLRKIFYPLGFPILLETNSLGVLAAAEASWSRYTSRFAKPPLTLRIGVTERRDEVGSMAEPVHRLQKNLLTNIISAHNFLVSDLSTGFSFGWITKEILEMESYFRYHLLEATALCMISALHATALHAACVVHKGHGMLLCGESGAGKSSLAFAGVRAGWTFVSDDAIYLPFDREDRTVVGNCHQFRLRDTSVKLFPDLKGRAVTSRMAGKPSIEISTNELASVRVTESSIVRSIIFLNRHHGGSPELAPLAKDRALFAIGRVPLAAPESQAAQESAIRHLVEVPAFELRYKDIDWAVTRLERLTAEGV